MNEELDDFFKPGTIVYTSGTDFISNAIRECQNLICRGRFGRKSEWTHVLWVGDDGMCYEATITFGAKIKNKIHITPFKKRFYNFKSSKMKKEYNRIAFQYLDHKVLTKKKIRQITESWKKTKHYTYGEFELLGTLWVLLKWKWYKMFGLHTKAKKLLQMKNPIDDPEKVYCIAGIADNIENCGIKFLEIESSIATVDEGYYNCQQKDQKVEKLFS